MSTKVLALLSASLLALAPQRGAPRPPQGDEEGPELPTAREIAAIPDGDLYRVDPTASMVFFRTKYLGVSYLYGRFREVRGDLFLVKGAPEDCTIVLEVEAASVDSGDETRDAWFRGPELLDAIRFPAITFQSGEIRAIDETHFEVKGDLTLHGVAREVSARVERTGWGRDPFGGVRVGFEIELFVVPSQFGIPTLRTSEQAEDRVHLLITVQAVLKHQDYRESMIRQLQARAKANAQAGRGKRR